MNLKNYITLFLFPIALFAQSNFLNNPSIYEFLDRQEIKGRINLNHHQKPYSRQDIQKHLQHLTAYAHDLNPTELEELKYYLKEYSSVTSSLSPQGDESLKATNRDASANLSDVTLSDQQTCPPLFCRINKPVRRYFVGSTDLSAVADQQTTLSHVQINTPVRRGGSSTFLSTNNNDAFRFYEYSDSLFYVNVYPDFGASYSIRNNSKSRLFYYNGFAAYGNIGKNFSFDILFNDYSINKNDYSVNRKGYSTDRIFSNERGFDYAVYKDATKSINYDRTIAAITYSWNWGFVSLRKDYNKWGTGYNGNLILSDKAPSFPFIQFKMKPIDWLEFNYIHGDLISSINDSLTIRNSGGSRGHVQLVDKYFASHFLTADIFTNLKLSLGESIVYSDRFEPIYLVPFLFFRMADHYLSHTDLNSGNAQMFASISYRIPSISTRIDASIFIDELSISNIFGKYPEAVAYNIGITNYDLFIQNLGIQFEYTRINPFVYIHGDPAQTYANRQYNMGHWIGGNADQFFLKLLYKPIPLLRLHASFEYTRKGDFEDISQPRYQKTQTFLFGDKSYYSTFRLNAEYEFINNLFLTAEGTISNSWGTNNQINPADYKFTQFTLGFHYGFQ